MANRNFLNCTESRLLHVNIAIQNGCSRLPLIYRKLLGILENVVLKVPAGQVTKQSSPTVLCLLRHLHVNRPRAVRGEGHIRAQTGVCGPEGEEGGIQTPNLQFEQTITLL